MLLSKSLGLFFGQVVFTRVTLPMPFANEVSETRPICATPPSRHVVAKGNHFDDLRALEVDGNTRGVPSETTRPATGRPGPDTLQTGCLRCQFLV